MACTKLHNLRMTPSMLADKYTPQFEIMTVRMSFNYPALEDTYSHDLPAMILDKIHAQPSFPKDLNVWKEFGCQIDCNHHHLLEVKEAQVPLATTGFSPAQMNSISVTINPSIALPHFPSSLFRTSLTHPNKPYLIGYRELLWHMTPRT